MKNLLLLVSFLLIYTNVQAHSGRTDASGCHHDRRTGGYHCHGGRHDGKEFKNKDEMDNFLKENSRTPASEKTKADTQKAK